MIGDKAWRVVSAITARDEAKFWDDKCPDCAKAALEPYEMAKAHGVNRIVVISDAIAIYDHENLLDELGGNPYGAECAWGDCDADIYVAFSTEEAVDRFCAWCESNIELDQ